MKSRHESSKKPVTKAMVKDPVCGMDVDPKKAGAHVRIEGKDQYFCSSGCRDQFEEQRQACASSDRPIC